MMAGGNTVRTSRLAGAERLVVLARHWQKIWAVILDSGLSDEVLRFVEDKCGMRPRSRFVREHIRDKEFQYLPSYQVGASVLISHLLMYAVDNVKDTATKVKNMFTTATSFALHFFATPTPVFDHSSPATVMPD